MIRFGALGDVLHTLPAVRALAEHGFAVDYLTAPGAAPIVEGQPGVARVVRFDRRGADAGLRGLLRVAGRLRAARYAVVADLQGNFRTRCLVLATGAGRRVRYRKDPNRTPRHAADNFAATLAPLGLGVFARAPGGVTVLDPPHRRLAFVPDAAARARAERAVGTALDRAGRVVAFHMGTSTDLKRWSAERFGELARRLLVRDPDLRVAFTDTEADRPLAEAAAAACTRGGGERLRTRLLDLCGALDMAALGAFYRRCDLVVVGDTGPLHMAVAVGARCVTIFGPTDPVRTGPLGEGHRVVRSALDCVPCCRTKQCARPDRSRACLAELSVDQVEAAVRASLEGASRPGAEALA